MRIIVFTGKGGSGLSTLAAASAAAAAGAGRRTLAFGLHPGLGAAFDLPLSGEHQAVADNLRADSFRSERKIASETGAEPPGESISTTTARTRASPARPLMVRTISGPLTVMPMVPAISSTAIRGADQGISNDRGKIPSMLLLLDMGA